MSPWLSPHLRASLQHALQSRGGGFRANLVDAMCQACGINKERASSLSTALEYFHLASLLLDDLPCMDNAETRRGLPCTHRVYGESMAILTALALLNRAYFLIFQAAIGMPVSVQEKVNELADECLGLNGILNGQALDLKFAASARTPASIENIAQLKTGSLLRLSILLPALIGSEDADTAAGLRRLAEKWGAIYQLLDDFKDVEWSEDVSGKTPMRDARLKRPNLALAIGKEQAVNRLRMQIAAARQFLTELGDAPAVQAALEPFQEKLEQDGGAFLARCAA